MNKILVQEADFDLTTEVKIARNHANNIGAVVSFVGTVRDLEDAPIRYMELEHYPNMTKKALESIALEAQKKWPIDNVVIIHRVGKLEINEQIVLVITTAQHRKEAFQACEFIMDYLKTRAPFWKKEYTNDGKSSWVESKISDQNEVKRWQKTQNT